MRGRLALLFLVTTAAAQEAPFDPAPYLGQGDAYNCADFASQAEAQAVLRAVPRRRGLLV